MNKIMRFVCGVGVVLSALGMLRLARAAEPTTWLDVSVTSHHFSDKKFNQNNFGLGFEHSWGDTLVMAGEYDNSLGAKSRYLLAGATPWHVGGADIGLVAGGLDGYRNMQGGHPFLAAAGLIRFTGKDYGANLLILPPAKGSPWAIGLQFKRRF